MHPSNPSDRKRRGRTAGTPAVRLPGARTPLGIGEEVLDETTIRIREGEERDLEAIYQLGLASPALQPSATAPFLEKDELAGLLRDVCLVAEVEDRLAGFLVAEIFGQLGYIALLAVAPVCLRQGVARRLLEECKERLRKKGVRRLGGFAHRDEVVGRLLTSFGCTAGKTYVWMDREI